ncbi:hypothetical protein N9P87_01325 [bacterium]|nr:hypothetical protein [bacterium]
MEGLAAVLVIIGFLIFVIVLSANRANKANANDLAAVKARADMFARADRIAKADKAKSEEYWKAKAEEDARKAKAEEDARKAKAEEDARKANAAEFAAARKVFLLWAIDVDLNRLNKIAFIVSEIEGFDLYSKSNGVSQLTIEQMIEIQKSYPAGSHGEIKPPAPQTHPTQNSTRENKYLSYENQSTDNVTDDGWDLADIVGGSEWLTDDEAGR